MNDETKWHGPRLALLVLVVAMSSIILVLGGSRLIASLRAGDHRMAAYVAFASAVMLAALASNIRFYRMAAGAVEFRSAIGTKRVPYGEIESIEPWMSSPGVEIASGYTVRAAKTKFWILVDSEEMELFVRALKRRVLIRGGEERPADLGDTIGVYLGKSSIFGLGLPILGAIAIGIQLARNGQIIGLVFAALGVMYVIRQPTRLLFTSDRIEVQYLGRRSSLEAKSLVDVQVHRKMFQTDLILRFQTRRLVLSETMYGFSANALAQRVKELYDLPDSQPSGGFRR